MVAARILRALIAVDGFVILIDGSDGITLAVAFEDLAIHRGLSHRQIRTCGREVVAADGIGACARFAEIVRSLAIRRHRASNARAGSVADQEAATRRADCFVRVTGNTRATDIQGTRIVVLREVRIVDFVPHSARSVTNNAMTIAERLIGNGQTHRRKGLSARMIDAGAFLTVVIGRQSNAISSAIALDTCTHVVADLGLSDDTWCAK